MGFFNKILKGLGFEDEEEPEVKPVKVKEKKAKKNNNITASYNLNKYDDEIDNEQNNPINEQNIVAPQEETETQKLDFDVVKVKNQVDVQNAVKLLASGQMILLNIEQLSESDTTRSLDFITGAVFALGLKMQKIDEKIYLIQ